MIRKFIVVGILLFYSAYLQAQQKSVGISEDEKYLINSEMQRYEKLFGQKYPASIASGWFDVTYYKLNLSVSTNPQFLKGCVTIKGVCHQISDTILVLDLKNNMHIDSIYLNGSINNFYQDSSSFRMKLGNTYSVGDQLAIDVFYGGLPVGTGFGSFVFGAHSGTPWVWSLSEPYGAKDWFPCKDHPSDKADSADIIVTCDSSFKVGSNGKLVSVISNGDGTKTHHWQEHYPISTYLISVAMTNYEQFSNWFQYTPTDSMEVLNYVLPEHLTTALTELPRTIDMLKIYSDLFGLYPFIKEKYGHADFGWGGAMEHQTMTSTTRYSEYTVAHELAHQWFGDMITCRTWSNIWLNEGFAQYSTALYLEKKYGLSEYRNYMVNQLSSARLAKGTIYIYDTSTVQKLFNSSLVYSKGAVVLHMLRHVLGDSLFFKSLYNYANHPLLKYASASAKDFQSICESTSGKDLGYFFDEWIYGEGFPHYFFSWNVNYSLGSYIVTVELDQKAGTASPTFFTMPLDIKMVGEGWDTTITVFNNEQHQVFSISIPRSVNAVQLDPERWVLKDVNEDIPSIFTLSQNYPNPFNANTCIEYKIAEKSHVSLVIYNLLGQKISTLVDEEKTRGNYYIIWEARGVPTGIYFYRLQIPNHQEQKKMIFIK